MKRHLQRGSSTVEFAIAAMAILMFVFGILEFGRALYTYHTVANLARLGTRWAIVRGSGCTVLDSCNAGQTEVQNYVRTQAFALMNTGNINVTASWPGTPAATCLNGATKARGCLVSVTVSYPFDFWVPLIGGAQAFTIASTSQMIISN